MATWEFGWENGRTILHSPGGMLGETYFRIGDRWLSPFYEAPWLERHETIESKLIANMRADYACVALGRPHTSADGLPPRWAALCVASRDEGDGISLTESEWLPHGWGVHHEWQLVSKDPAKIVIGIDYPVDSPISRLERTVSATPNALEVSLRIEARRQCRRPVGLHPNFALRGPPGSFLIEPGPFAFGLTHPIGEIGVSCIQPDAEFQSLQAVPLRLGGNMDLSRLPLPFDTEEFIQLCGLSGTMRMIDLHAGVEWTLEWDPRQLPSCWFWISNRGRKHAPWNGENVCLGVILANAPMNLGPRIAAATNPIAARGIATALDLHPDFPMTLSYRLAGRPVSPNWRPSNNRSEEDA